MWFEESACANRWRQLHPAEKAVPALLCLIAIQDIDLAYAWADDICVLDRGALAFFGRVEEFSARIATLPDTRLGFPWVLEVSDTLRRRFCSAHLCRQHRAGS